jgi:hypothetical protein
MDETKPCPYCGERVLATAIKCKHCGSDISAGVLAAKRQFTARPALAVAGVAILILFAVVWVVNLGSTGSPTAQGFTAADVERIEQDIRAQYAKRHEIVEQVGLIRESPTKVTGFVKIKRALLGTVMEQCTATWGIGGQYIWQCK